MLSRPLWPAIVCEARVPAMVPAMPPATKTPVSGQSVKHDITQLSEVVCSKAVTSINEMPIARRMGTAVEAISPGYVFGITEN